MATGSYKRRASSDARHLKENRLLFIGYNSQNPNVYNGVIDSVILFKGLTNIRSRGKKVNFDISNTPVDVSQSASNVVLAKASQDPGKIIYKVVLLLSLLLGVRAVYKTQK